MDRVEQYRALLERWQAAGLDRRQFLRLVAVGASAVSLSAIIAACGGDNNDKKTATTGTGGSTPGSSAAASPTPAVDVNATPVINTVGSPEAITGGAAPTSAPFVDKPITIALNVEPDNLDVHDTTSNASAGVDKCIYEGLVTLDEKMRVVNLLAESWEISDDAKEFTFKLQQGVKFHDGEPFNAEAVAKSYDRVLSPDSTLKRHGYFSAVLDKVEAVDEYTVKFIAKQPFAAMVATLAHPSGGIPSPTAAAKSGQDFGSNPVGTGPFRFVEWVRGDHITLEANPDYWNKDLAASVSKMTVKGISEPGALAIAVQSGDAAFSGPLDAAQAQQLKSAGNVDVTESPGITVHWVTLNNSKDPFKDVKVRQALNYGVNKEEVLKAASLGEGYVVDSPIARGVWGYKAVGGYAYDPEKAKQLLSDAGHADGFKSQLWTSAISRDRAVAVQAQLAKIGVDVEVVQMESAALTAETAKPVEESQIQMLMSNWSPSTGDADWALRPIYTKAQWPPAGSTTSFFTDPEVEKYVQQGLELTDPDQRAEAYGNAQKAIMDAAPNIFLYAPIYFGAIDKKAGGMTVQPDGVVYLRTAYWKE
jgi:glutathione transport system substrate-binding protein